MRKSCLFASRSISDSISYFVVLRFILPMAFLDRSLYPHCESSTFSPKISDIIKDINTFVHRLTKGIFFGLRIRLPSTISAPDRLCSFMNLSISARSCWPSPSMVTTKSQPLSKAYSMPSLMHRPLPTFLECTTSSAPNLFASTIV